MNVVQKVSDLRNLVFTNLSISRLLRFLEPYFIVYQCELFYVTSLFRKISQIPPPSPFFLSPDLRKSETYVKGPPFRAERKFQNFVKKKTNISDRFISSLPLLFFFTSTIPNSPENRRQKCPGLSVPYLTLLATTGNPLAYFFLTLTESSVCRKVTISLPVIVINIPRAKAECSNDVVIYTLSVFEIRQAAE